MYICLRFYAFLSNIAFVIILKCGCGLVCRQVEMNGGHLEPQDEERRALSGQ